MMGAIAGDVIGSVFEKYRIKTKEFPLFSKKNRFTDDSVTTIAIADAVLNGAEESNFIESLKKYCNRYPHAGYGSSFKNWLKSEDTAPYNSWGNGSAMRVSSIAWLFDSLDDVRYYAKLSASVTHNHPEGIKGAEATASAIYLARSGFSKNHIKTYIESEYGYDLSKSLDEIRPDYKPDVSCQGTVPEAIICYIEAKDFEDAIRNAISLGGDSDTLAAIAGSIAEGSYEIPDIIKLNAFHKLKYPLRSVYLRFLRTVVFKNFESEVYLRF